MTNAVSRIVVAVVLAPVVLVVAYHLAGWWLFGLVAVAAFISLHEFWLMARPLRPLAPAGYVAVVLGLVGAQLGGATWLLGGLLTSLALGFALKAISEARQGATISIGGTVLGTLWIGGGLGALILLRAIPANGALAVLTVLLAVWAGDTFAYLGGRLLGRHKMAPATSPGKTWEGFVFGSAATVFVTFVALYERARPHSHGQHFLSIGQSLVLGAVLAAAAPLGDLFESLLKRDAGVKDSGTLLGGHGGMLDRLDAFLFAAPAAYWCILAFGHA